MPTSKQYLVLGGPGCGKTTKLLDLIADTLENGVQPREILFCSFTKKAANEALERVKERFNLSKAELPFFKTIHALAFHQLGLSTGQVIGKKDFEFLGKLLGLKFSAIDKNTGFISGKRNGDRIAYQEQILRVKSGDTFFKNTNQLLRYKNTLDAYKKEHGVMDHTDILDKFIDEGTVPPVKVVFVDEAQDLSSIQWRVIDKIAASSTVEKVYFAGDDDQAIYAWAGADIERFLSVDAEKIVLPVTYRLPKQVFEVANNISNQISHRYTKEWFPEKDDGCVKLFRRIEKVPFNPGTLILVRSNYMIPEIEHICRARGIAYKKKGVSILDSDDARAVRSFLLLKKGEFIDRKDLLNLYSKFPHGYKKVDHNKEQVCRLDVELPHSWVDFLVVKDTQFYKRLGDAIHEEPPVSISTIHSVKGGEAETVVLLQDVPPNTSKEMRKNRDDEHRVFYVAVTRAKKNLFLVAPKTKHCYKVKR